MTPPSETAGGRFDSGTGRSRVEFTSLADAYLLAALLVS